VAATDADGDGVGDEAERHLGTNPLGRCGTGSEAPNQSRNWPLDIVSAGVPNSTDRINILDLTSFLAPTRRLDQSPGDSGFNVRWDLVPGNSIGSNSKWIVIGDLTALFAGTPGFPPMNGGAKVFGTSFVCSAHPTFGQ
jgi:hypothetical protein